MEYGASRYPLSSHVLIDRKRKRFLAFARNDDTGKAAFSYLPPSSGRRCLEGTEARSCYQLKKNVRYAFPRIVIPSGVEGSFSLAVRGRVSDSEKRETPYREKVGAVLLVNGLAKESWKKGTKKISRCARNDSVGNGYVFPEMSDAPKL